MAGKAPKTVQLYFYIHKDGDINCKNVVVASDPPRVDVDGKFDHNTDSAQTAFDLCELGQDLFGLKGKIRPGEVTRLTLAVTAVEVATPRVVIDYAPVGTKK